MADWIFMRARSCLEQHHFDNRLFACPVGGDAAHGEADFLAQFILAALFADGSSGFIARFGKEVIAILLDGHALVKLEVLSDDATLFPNMPETIIAAKELVADGFQVMVYCSDDPIQAKMLEEIGCVAVMPLASLIGSGMGILNPWNLQIIIDRAKVPVLVDAGIGTASDAAIAMELGCDGVLMNTAIAKAANPVLMASAMKKAVEAGREAFLAGRMPKKIYQAAPSSPSGGLIGAK